MILKRIMDLILLCSVLGVFIFTLASTLNARGDFNVVSFLFTFSFLGFVPIGAAFVSRLVVYMIIERKTRNDETLNSNKKMNAGRYFELGLFLLFLVPFLILTLVFQLAG